MALNISPDNFNGALSQLCELTFYIIFIGGRFVFIFVTDAFHAHIFFLAHCDLFDGLSD
jgi:hypothetical protein